MTFHLPRFSPWQHTAIEVAKIGGTEVSVAVRIQALYPQYTWTRARAAAIDAVEKLERKGILYRDGGTLRLVTTETPNELTAP